MLIPANRLVSVGGSVNAVQTLELFLEQSTSSLYYNGSNWVSGATAIVQPTGLPAR